MTKFLNASNIKIIIVLLTATFLTYLNILPNQLFYDDEELIYKNVYIADLKFFPKYFTENMIAGAGKVSDMYRPLLLVSFALDHHIWGNNPFGYHLTSIFLHATNSILIFIFISLLFKNKLVAFMTSLLFIIHPIQTEAVAYASGRTDLLMTFFSLLSLIFFQNSIRNITASKWQYFASLLFFLLAILSKETAIVLPFLLILSQFVILIPLLAGERSHNLLKYSKRFFTSFRMTVVIIPFFLIDFIYILLRLTVLNFSNTLNFYQNANLYSQSLAVRLFTFSRVFSEYLIIIFFPKDLIFARDIRLGSTLFSPWVILFLLITAAFIFLSVKFWQKNKIFLFSFLWFFITILPVSGIIPINSIIAEHYLYFPSVSFFLLMAFLFWSFWQKYSSLITHLILVFILTFVTAILLIRTIIRNNDWKDPVTFYTKSLSQSPWSIPMRHNLAMTYADQGKYEIAIKEYQILISLADVYPQTHHNLANAYKAIGRYKEAEEEYKKALKMDPNFYFSYAGLLDLYQKTREKEKLQDLLEKLKTLKRL